MTPTPDDLPRYQDLMLPVLRAIDQLGGSATSREITDAVIGVVGLPDEAVSLQYPNRPKSVFVDRVDWARSYCKLGGAIESPRRGLFLMTELGREIAALPDEAASGRLGDLDRLVRSTRRRTKSTASTNLDDGVDEVEVLDEEADDPWKEQLLRRLHQLSPRAFEEFCVYLLRRFGLELTHVGGSGDEGIDAIGTAPMSPVLSATVAVQVKRYDPARSAVAREHVALFQRDASAKGAERAVMITLGRYSEPAKKASMTATPTVDLIDGERLVELIREQEIGMKIQPVIDEGWFERFER